MREIAIIGYGRLGKLAAFHLKQHAQIFVADKRPVATKSSGIKVVSIREAASKKYVILAVPINQMKNTLRQISPLLGPDAVVYDVCSVKEQPIEWMRKLLPPTVTIIGTHPLFGPDSAGKSLVGRSIALCPVRASHGRVKKTRSFLKRLGLQVTVMKPDAHDKLMASTLFLTQFICRGLNYVSLPEDRFTTQNYKLLKEIIDITNNDTSELFKDMYKYNRFARQIPKTLLRDFTRSAKSLQR